MNLINLREAAAAVRGMFTVSNTCNNDNRTDKSIRKRIIKRTERMREELVKIKAEINLKNR